MESQVVLENSRLNVFSKKHPIWLNSLILPAYASALSCVILVLHLILISQPARKLHARLFPSSAKQTDAASETPHEQSNPVTGFVVEIKEYVSKHGGATTFAYMAVRLVGSLALLGLSIASLVIVETETGRIGIAGKWGKKHKHKHGSHTKFTVNEWLQAAMCMTYLYTSFLALLTLCIRPRWSKTVSRHLSAVLFVTFATYMYRDFAPLATFHKVPKDRAEGWILTAKLITLSFIAAILPLVTPRQYVPADPKNPMAEPNPELTASILSFLTYRFLDPLIWKAYQLPHLPFDALPPLSDYDRAKVLTKNAMPHLDPFFSLKNKRHIFFGLMRVFRFEYMILAIMIIVNVISTFASPLGIYKILHYLETGNDPSDIQPWFWIIWLFLGPTIGSMAIQLYVFIATRTLVRAECIITQLVFEHSLRVRMKAETPESSGTASAVSSVAPSPDRVSLSEADHSHAESSTIGNDAVNGHGDSDGTAHSESSSVRSASTKTGAQKGKASQPAVEEKKKEATADNLVGKINNLITTDLGNIVEGRDFLFVVIYIPLQITLCIVFLYQVLGWSSIVGLAAILLLFPIPGQIARQIQKVQVLRLKKTDARVQTVSETMNVLRMIKLFGWERKMNEKVEEKREDELVWIKKRQILDLINGNLNFIIPLVTMIATFSTYTLVLGNDLNASKVFSSMAVFDMLRDQLHLVIYSVVQLVQGKVSLDRINDFLHNTELLDEFDEKKEENLINFTTHEETDGVVGFNDATFAWTSEPDDGTLTPSRRRFNLRIEGELTFKEGINLIIGPTGSGKTSLLMALLGEMHFIPSTPDSWYNLPRTNGIAYAAQESWVQNETIRENIIFGAPFDEERYKKVIYQCGLERDLELFQAGDNTEVGEKGLTLSGGQKARITLARAIYSKAQIILLDDVLAALDVHTSKWIIEKCFRGDLVKGRTVLLVTHNVMLASPIASFVVSLGLDGTIVSRGSVAEAIAKDEVLAHEVEQEEEEVKKAENEVDAEPVEEPKSADGKLTVAEEIALGHVSWDALKLYLSGLGGNHPLLFFLTVVLGLFITNLANVLQTWFLGYWAAQYETHPSSEVRVVFYLSIYASLLLFATIIYSCSFIVYVFGGLRASRKIHKQLIDSILGTTLRWLDTTPTSRVIARCTQDIRAIDGPVNQGLGWLLEMTTSMLMKFGAVIVLTPLFALPGIFIAVLGGWCGQIYMKAQLSVKREMSNAKSPVLGHFGAAVAGLTSIRAYGAQGAFRGESLIRIDRYTRSARTFYNLNRWICVRVDALGAAFSAGLASYLVYARSGTTSANTGFSLNMAIGFSSMILWWVREFNEFEVQGNSLERIQQYIAIEQEPKPTEQGKPPAAWPTSGDIRVEKLSARYSLTGPKVLHDISFSVNSGERVGVVGRTGSGKSSLTLSLLRCIFTEGTVYYDGIPTSSVNLDALRSNITIIPQIPELLSGTLRTNLDPFSQYDDATLNDALRAAGLFSLQDETDEGRITLDSAISSGGGNLSVGQRQILALARAIVRGSKLLILDEATSAIDYETDAVIQTSLRNELKHGVSLLIVAHRLQSIMDCDKIMVLDAGRIIEFGRPSELLKNKKGLLRALVDESNDKAQLIAMAEGH